MRNSPAHGGEEARHQMPPADRCQVFFSGSPRGWCADCLIDRLLDAGGFPILLFRAEIIERGCDPAWRPMDRRGSALGSHRRRTRLRSARFVIPGAIVAF